MQENGPQQKFSIPARPIVVESPDMEIQDRPGEGGSTLIPDPEIRWLERLDEFERQHKNGNLVSVREFIGYPQIPRLIELPQGEVEIALDRLLDTLADQHIAVDFIFETDPHEAYRFITEEVLDELIADVRLPGIVLHFTYEEFHPNEPEDARHWAEEFLHGLFTWNEERMRSALGAVGPPPGLRASPALKQTVADFYAQFPQIAHYAVDPIRAAVEGDVAAVEIDTLWQGQLAGKSGLGNFAASWRIGLERSPYSGWDVVMVVRV